MLIILELYEIIINDMPCRREEAKYFQEIHFGGLVDSLLKFSSKFSSLRRARLMNSLHYGIPGNEIAYPNSLSNMRMPPGKFFFLL